MFVGKFREKITNYYVVFVGRKRGVCDSWIECQRRVIFYKGGHTKPTLPKTELCYHGFYIHQDGSHLMDLVLEYLLLFPIVDMKMKKQREKCSSAIYICSFLGS